jgi:hypothetical protein
LPPLSYDGGRVSIQFSTHVVFVVDSVALGQVSFEYLGFPYESSFHQLYHDYLSSGAAIIGKIVADVPSWFSLSTIKNSMV